MLMTGCNAPSPRLRDLPPDGAELPILRQVQGVHCHETLPMQVVVRDAATWAQIPLVDILVDFDEEMLLVVTLGRQPTEDVRVEVEQVWRDGYRLRVQTRVTQPTHALTTTISTPFCVAVVPKCDLNVAEFSNAPPPRNRTWNPSEPPAQW